jgi:hypothetical protein
LPTTEKKCHKIATNLAPSNHRDKQYFRLESIDTSNIIEDTRETLADQVILKPEHTTSFMRLRERKTEKLLNAVLRTYIHRFIQTKGTILSHIIVYTVF